MSDAGDWQAPGSDGSSPQHGAHSGGSSPYAPQLPSSPHSQQWRPAPRPGPIPLRPLELGALLAAPFAVLRRNPRPIFGAALVVSGLVLVLSVVLPGVVGFLGAERLSRATAENADEIGAGFVGAIIVSTLVPVLISLAANAFLQGLLAVETSRAALGEKNSYAALWRRARGRLGALIGYTFLVALAVAFVLTVLGAVVALLAVLGDPGVIAAVLVALAAVIGGVVLALWLGTKLAFVPSALMVERLTLRRSLGRSWRLVRGHFWRILGIQLLVGLIIGIATSVLSAPLQIVLSLAPLALAPGGESWAIGGILITVGLVSLLLTIVGTAVASIVQTVTTATLYLDTRMRSEGLDLDLQRWVEQRDAGAEPLDDPYRSPAAP